MKVQIYLKDRTDAVLLIFFFRQGPGSQRNGCMCIRSRYWPTYNRHVCRTCLRIFCCGCFTYIDLMDGLFNLFIYYVCRFIHRKEVVDTHTYTYTDTDTDTDTHRPNKSNINSIVYKYVHSNNLYFVAFFWSLDILNEK